MSIAYARMRRSSSVSWSRRWTVCLAFALLAGAGSAHAQPYPSKPIKLTVGFSAGGGTDIFARLIAAEMRKALGQPVIVENLLGASGNIAVAHVAKSAPDGYTAGFFTSGTMILLPVFDSTATADGARDLMPVSQVLWIHQVMVARPSFPANTVRELVALAKGGATQVSLAHSGIGTTAYIAALMLENSAGIRLLKVAYKGEPPLLNDVVGEHVDIGMVTAQSTKPFSDAGKVKVLASLSGSERPSLFPNAQTIAEAGYPDIDTRVHYGVYVPLGTPSSVIERLYQTVSAAVKVPEVRSRLLALGGSPVGSRPEEYSALVRADRERAQKLQKSL